MTEQTPGLGSDDSSRGGGLPVSCHARSPQPRNQALERAGLLTAPVPGSRPSATHRIQLEEGFRGPFKVVGQHVDVSWDGDGGLPVLERE